MLLPSANPKCRTGSMQLSTERLQAAAVRAFALRRTAMSITEPTLLSLARATVVSLATLTVLLIGGPSVQSWPRKMRAFIFWIGMAALLAPGFAAA